MKNRKKRSASPCGGVLPVFPGISAAAVVGAVMLVQHALVAPVGTVAAGNAGEVSSEKAETPVIPGEKRELLRTPTLFELQGGDERVPVIAPAVIRKILPEKEY